jgi:hypothetical protein
VHLKRHGRRDPQEAVRGSIGSQAPLTLAAIISMDAVAEVPTEN